MSIQNMHYDFKQKFNKIDSQSNRNLRVPEIDWRLNEAFGILIKLVAMPRSKNQFGFETSIKSIEDIRELLIEGKQVTPGSFGDGKSYKVTLTPDLKYGYLVSCQAEASKGSCTSKVLQAFPVQHDDRHEESTYNQSSFEWRETNYRFYSEGIRFFTDGTFIITKVVLDYIKKPDYMHFANGVPGGTYNLPDGTVLTGVKDCEVSSEIVQREIVDLAVLIASWDIYGDHQAKAAKVKLND